MDKPSIESLVMKLKKGDREAFERIVDEYQKTIFNMVYRMVNNYEDARDLTQSVFIKAYQNMHTYDPSYKFFSWLYRIAVNECLNHNKKRKIEYLDRDIEMRHGSPEDSVAHRELSDQISKALMTLTVPYRTVLVLKHFNDFSYKEISEILEIPVKTVKSRLFTGRQLLKDQLIQQGLSL
jgi:RNA polymerase sigma-70 factor (ECF subfamily)